MKQIMDEIHKIMEKIYQKHQNMTEEEIIKDYNESTKRLCQRGLKLKIKEFEYAGK